MELKGDVGDIRQEKEQERKQQNQKGEERQGGREDQDQREQYFHVLAVDDSVIDQKLLEKLLRISSCKVTCVESGDKALRYLGLLSDLEDQSSSTASSPSSQTQSQQEELKVNLIMTDFCMPGMSGYDLLRRLKGSSWKDVPVVVMSSENVPSRISMCLEEGAEEFLLKPLQLSDLKKLQPYLLKSGLSHSCSCTDHTNQGEDDNENNLNKNSNQNSAANNVSKRKAMSPEPSERRPKIKELTVL